MTILEQLKEELERYEAAHNTSRRHPDGRLESRPLIALIGRAVLELAATSVSEVNASKTGSCTRQPLLLNNDHELLSRPVERTKESPRRFV